MKIIVLFCFVTVLTGCATSAQIQVPDLDQNFNQSFSGKSISYEIMYSQPKPGIFSDGEQMSLTPLNEVELSVASSSTLVQLPSYIAKQLPITAKQVEIGQGDLNLIVELTAYDKKGPTFADYEFLKSFFKGIFTLGIGANEYDIIANFDTNYRLYDNEGEVYSKNYKVNDSVDHEKGDFESYDSLFIYTRQLLEKHITLTLSDFFTEYSSKFQK